MKEEFKESITKKLEIVRIEIKKLFRHEQPIEEDALVRHLY